MSSIDPFQKYDLGPKIDMGHVTLTTPTSRIVSHHNFTWPPRVQKLKSLALAAAEIYFRTCKY